MTDPTWRKGAIFLVLLAAAAAILLLVYWLEAPMAALLRAGGDLRGWLLSLGPLAPLVYVLFYAAQILVAPLPGSMMALVAGYVFGFRWGLFLSLVGLALGASLAIWIARTVGRPLLERAFGPAELTRWERKLRLRSPLVWYVFFLFPVPDVVIYVAGLGTLPVRVLLPAILLGRATSILLNTALGTATAILPAQVVIVQWLLLGLLAFAVYRYQRPLRYRMLVAGRRLRRRIK
ncbi:MAG: TVP38/TMEM64 family protein [Caldilineaceae bacterium]|nr:TVP38/TMEM64 family protein [Caldilineaceae bacterium]